MLDKGQVNVCTEFFLVFWGDFCENRIVDLNGYHLFSNQLLEFIMEPTEEMIFVERGPKETIVTFMDEKILSQEQIQQLQGSLMGLIEQVWSEKLILDFCNVKGLSSSVIGLLLVIRKKISKEKGRLQLRNISPTIYEVFKIMKMTEIFEII